MLNGRDAGASGLGELRHRVSKAVALIGLYERHANSAVKSEAELVQLQEEMKVMKAEIISELTHSKGLLKRMQQGGAL